MNITAPSVEGTREIAAPAAGVASGDWFGVGGFPTGEARAVNVGTAKKPCWVIEGPKPSAADIEWAREIALAAIPRRTAEEGATATPDCAQSAGTQNRWTSPEESDDREASGECVPAENFSPNAADDAQPKAVASGRLFEEPAGKSSGNSKLQKRAE